MVEKRGYDNTTESPSTHTRKPNQPACVCIHVMFDLASLRVDLRHYVWILRRCVGCGVLFAGAASTHARMTAAASD